MKYDVNMEIQEFWDKTPYRMVQSYSRFGTTFYLHIQSESSTTTPTWEHQTLQEINNLISQKSTADTQ